MFKGTCDSCGSVMGRPREVVVEDAGDGRSYLVCSEACELNLRHRARASESGDDRARADRRSQIDDDEQALAKLREQPEGTPIKRAMSVIENRIASGVFDNTTWHIPPTQMLRLFAVALGKNPALAECTVQSLAGAYQNALMLGLNPTNFNNSASLVPYKGECKLVPGYNGLIQLVVRHPLYARIEADCVFPGDRFYVRRGTTPCVEHEYGDSDRTDDSEITHAYAICFMHDSAVPPQFEVMTRAQVEKNRKASKRPMGEPWVQWWHQMARKTAVIRLTRYLPMAPEAAAAIDLVHDVEGADFAERDKAHARQASKQPQRATDSEQALDKILEEGGNEPRDFDKQGAREGDGALAVVGGSSPEGVADGQQGRQGGSQDAPGGNQRVQEQDKPASADPSKGPRPL